MQKHAHESVSTHILIGMTVASDPVSLLNKKLAPGKELNVKEEQDCFHFHYDVKALSLFIDFFP